MDNQQVILDALAEKITKLEQEKLGLIKEWDNINSDTLSRYLSHIKCFIRSASVDIDGFLDEKRRQYTSTPLDERTKFVRDTLDIMEYLYDEIGDQRLLDFHDDFSKML